MNFPLNIRDAIFRKSTCYLTNRNIKIPIVGYFFWSVAPLALFLQNQVFSYGQPVGGDLNADGIINDDDSGYADFYQKQ
ncbi:hypothetical protein SAMN04488514_105243 [Kriegella aquimaris]|uniref:Uncharacterized protein n=1 Tax=Kriegella aquimaris TaxID=192904 RepID=A0A1G9QWE1_9FLAO|nr:hypothetical protein SAMN04488514_105243 [Kriegella aquimaris]